MNVVRKDGVIYKKVFSYSPVTKEMKYTDGEVGRIIREKKEIYSQAASLIKTK